MPDKKHNSGLLGQVEELLQDLKEANASADELKQKFEWMLDKKGELMATVAQVSAIVQQFKDATTAIGTVIQGLKDQLASGGLSAAEETQALADLQAQADALTAMGNPGSAVDAGSVTP